jgi:hypothetical protein
MRQAAIRNVIAFPTHRTTRAARGGATFVQIMVARCKRFLGMGLSRIGFPGLIKPMSWKDETTGQNIDVSVGDLFVCLSVNGRDYYFNRLTGEFDGTGSSSTQPTF